MKKDLEEKVRYNAEYCYAKALEFLEIADSYAVADRLRIEGYQKEIRSLKVEIANLKEFIDVLQSKPQNNNE